MAHLFNGTNDSLEVGTAPVTAYPFTLACWCNPGSTAGQVLMALGVAGGIDRCALVIGGTSIASAGSNNSGTGNASAFAGTAGSGSWVHVAGVFESATSRLVYFNGAAGTPNTTTVTMTGLNRLNLGARYNTTLGAFFGGLLAEAVVYNAALTAAEILSLSKRYRPDRIRPQNLVYLDRLIRTPQDLRGGRLITQLGAGTTPSPHPAILFP